ncbi:MAG: acetate--CoA ligase family protein [Pigmentiphaga sp.]|nr:acetate--CoA ligase family protein [Pigmentiphaga sp.]
MHSHAATPDMAESRGRAAVALGRTLDPRSIAILGASPEPTAIGSHVLANLERYGYAGELHLISRTRDEIAGKRCLKSLEDMPEGVDVVVLCIPEAGVLDAVRACAARGVGGVVIFASGYAEAGDDGRAKQDELAAIARGAGMVLIGPNCMGYTSFTAGVPVTFEPQVPQYRLEEARGVSVVAQSGAMAANLRDALLARWVPIAQVASTGNEACVGVEDYVAHFVADPSTAAIGVYAEQIRHPRLFLRLAAEARRVGKPIVLLMPGRSARAREAAASHTGALAGDHASAVALLRGEAVIVVDSQDELYDTLAILARHPQPRPGGPGIVTGSGAIKSLAIDFADDIGLDLPVFRDTTVAALTALLPDYAVPENPLDYTTVIMRNPNIAREVLDVAVTDEGVGSVLLTMITGPLQGQRNKAKTMIPALADRAIPAILVALGDTWPIGEELAAAIREHGIIVFRSLERALRALRRIDEYAADLLRAGRRGALAAAELPLPGAIPANGIFAEYQGKRWLRDAGLEIPAGELAGDVEQAVDIARRIGYPVVLKAQASELPHKSDAGGVVVGLADEAALRAGWRQLTADVARHRPGLALDGVLVEAMGAKGLELVVGARRDSDWGPVVLVGLGGVWIEALHDVRLLPPDLAVDDIVVELGKLKAAPLLKGVRGAPPVDVPAVARVVAALGARMLADQRILEMDVNPLVAYPDRALALDALLVCAAEAGAHAEPEVA